MVSGYRRDGSLFAAVMSEFSGPDFTGKLRETTFSHDQAGRLSSVGFDHTGSGCVDETVSYLYDAGGLRTQLTLQMTHDGTHTLTYDPNGNLTSDGINSYTWDRANRMRTFAGATYTYDGLGNRAD